MTSVNLKKIKFSRESVIAVFAAISEAIDVGEAKYTEEGSNRVEEDWRIMQTVFAARAVVEEILDQLGPWANAFGFNPRDPEEVKLSWSLTVGKAVGICQELLRELSPGWQSRGRIGSNGANTVDALLEALDQVNAADLVKALQDKQAAESEDSTESTPGSSPKSAQSAAAASPPQKISKSPSAREKTPAKPRDKKRPLRPYKS